MKNKSLNKLFLSITIVFILLFSITTFMFYMVDKKSDEMIHHKSALIKDIHSIKYNLTTAHLWFMEYLYGDIKERKKIKTAFNNVDLLLKTLKESKKTKTEILLEIEDINKSIHLFKKLTFLYLKHKVSFKNFNDVNYDIDFEIIIDKINSLEKQINQNYKISNKEFKSYKQNVYLFIFILVLFTIVFTVFIIKKIKNNIDELRKKDEVIAEQYKLAAMGEMIDAIAHQWKNPLGIIRMHADYTQISIELKESNFEHIKRDMKSIMLQVDHLIDTINEFRSFFRPDTKTAYIGVKTLIDSTLILVKDELIKHTISTNIICDETIKIDINQNEFKHVLINLIQNSKDAFEENSIKDRQINFELVKNKKSFILKISDNAGGIKDEVLDKIFIPHFTTKAESKGTGIGLYLSKQIIEKHGANIEVQNLRAGVCFNIIFKR